MTGFTPFSLSSLDHSIVAVYVPQNLCFRTSDTQQCLSRLQAGINLLLTRLPFLTGEIVPRTDHGAKPGELRIQPGNTWDAIPMLTIQHFTDVILPPVLVRETTIHRRKLTAWSPAWMANVVTDGVILSMAFSHSVLDGTGTGRVHEMLAECCRAAATESTPSLPTDGDEEAALRSRLTTAGNGFQSEIDHSGDIGQSYDYESKEDDNASKQEDSRQLLAGDLKTRAFTFSPEKLEHLRKACSAFIPLLTELYTQTTADNTTKWPTFLSSNDVLTGLLGACIERARKETGVDVSSPTRNLTFAVNFRKRLTTIPDHYLGNAVMPGHIYFKLPVDKHPDLESLANSVDLHPLQGSGVDAPGLLEIANQAFQSRTSIIAFNDAYIRSWMSSVSRQPDYGSMNLRYGDIIGSSWRKLKVDSLDFGPGLGPVDNFEVNINFADGTCTVMPERRIEHLAIGGKAPWNVRISLVADSMAKFERDSLIDWLADRVV